MQLVFTFTRPNAEPVQFKSQLLSHTLSKLVNNHYRLDRDITLSTVDVIRFYSNELDTIEVDVKELALLCATAGQHYCDQNQPHLAGFILGYLTLGKLCAAQIVDGIDAPVVVTKE